MSRTLFWYIFKDLVRIFLMASGALAGIMSFGGLLRPLTRQGLDMSQVGQVLTWLGPAMTTYSYPIAALFATTVVYGRLSADNELTACKSGGISLISLTVAGPALVLGLLVAFVSLLFLCFVVPACTLRVEKVLYSNLAKLVASQVERTHEVRFNQFTIFAQEAYIPPPALVPHGQQQVVLRGPTIVTVERPRPGEPDYRVPKEFWTAAQATVFIDEQTEDEKTSLTIHLDKGFKFPRRFLGAMQAGIEETECGPMEIPSPIKEDTKFMNVFRLKRLYNNPSESRKLSALVASYIQADQAGAFYGDAAAYLNGTSRQISFDFEGGERYVLTREAQTPLVEIMKDEVLGHVPPGDKRHPYAFRRERIGNKAPLSIVRAAELRLHAQPASDGVNMDCSLTLVNCVSETEEGQIPRANFTQRFSVPMNPRIQAIAHNDLRYYQDLKQPRSEILGRQLLQLYNEILAESSARASFAISCLILVMVGCALGMIFRSGNFLTAFAVSFVPALMSITLIIAGQRTAGNVSSRGVSDPLYLGLALIWCGNAINLVIATCLLYRLNRR